ncbi:hypothetical protein GLOIN_2v1791345 [Rhizophagus irregularis DAOM 181602=DAOM 197198]|uniref:Uncharacterized protein n=1 Tax=Rhizophagus irregularis (strain DAOM 181602 / DAOM 197198 / MUCL 43194) TaxID=747089 RepID=A0A2P4NX95_RHIID|nr:hypothetical protein GLOIN_2v1791345 [Rhizophagus irregularis DAOM 181602=DAOM 197198]POG57757.1 hypothetical protein GLOIN_2v1791345 [Rhizophagus irregularis DAOM 181602=DAOM 197198]|eukprot:XP_025164623.1 hypothetical protein GLOIN_2v1791345 [Rhizophagus irregularis DAOM 181602=DAOM 197198]
MNKRKSQTKSYNTTLLTTGKIILEIHYGHFSREWWIATENNINDQATRLVPIRLGMQTLTKLNSYEFIIVVLGADIEITPGPRYQANCYFINNELINGDICTNSSFAITSLYKRLFGTKTKFSGPLVMGFDQEIIVEKLLKDVKFQPFEFFVGRLQIVVFGIGISNSQEWNYAGEGYQSSFIDNVNKKLFLYVQTFTAKKSDVWSQVDYKPKFDANKLFGVDNEYTQTLISKLQIPSCTPEEWNNLPLLQQIFEYHLKKRTISDVNWMGFIENWKNQQSEIIELRISLMQLYGSESL